MSGKTAAQMVAEAKAEVEELTPDQVEAELAGGAVLVDVREDAECAQASIPGALHIVRGMLEFMADPSSPRHAAQLAPNKRVIMQCASGGRSALSAMTMKQLGYTNVANLDGGMQAWIAAGKPVVRG